MSLRQHKFWYLNQVNLFSGLNESEIMEIADKMFDKHCAKKEILYTPFDAVDSIYVLKKGEVSLYSSHNGRKIIIEVLRPGSIFGNISFDDQAGTHFAEVTEDAYICCIHKDSFRKIVEWKPELMMKLIQIMSERIHEYETKMKGSVLDAKEKVMQALSMLENKSKKTNLSLLFSSKTKITHTNIAHHTGLSRETVTRSIQALKKEGKIRQEGDGTLKINSEVYL